MACVVYMFYYKFKNITDIRGYILCFKTVKHLYS